MVIRLPLLVRSIHGAETSFRITSTWGGVEEPNGQTGKYNPYHAKSSVFTPRFRGLFYVVAVAVAKSLLVVAVLLFPLHVSYCSMARDGIPQLAEPDRVCFVKENTPDCCVQRFRGFPPSVPSTTARC